MAATVPAVNSPMLSMGGGTAPSIIYTTTANQTIALASDVSCFSATGQGPGQTIAGNAAYVGNTYRLQIRGVYSTPLANVATVTGKLKWGSTTIATITTAALPASASNFPFFIDLICVIRSIGGSGSIVCTGGLSYVSALSGLSFLYNDLTTVSPVTIDTTTASVLDITGAWSTVAGGQTASGITGTIEILF